MIIPFDRGQRGFFVCVDHELWTLIHEADRVMRVAYYLLVVLKVPWTKWITYDRIVL